MKTDIKRLMGPHARAANNQRLRRRAFFRIFGVENETHTTRKSILFSGPLIAENSLSFQMYNRD